MPPVQWESWCLVFSLYATSYSLRVLGVLLCRQTLADSTVSASHFAEERRPLPDDLHKVSPSCFFVVGALPPMPCNYQYKLVVGK